MVVRDVELFSIEKVEEEREVTLNYLLRMFIIEHVERNVYLTPIVVGHGEDKEQKGAEVEE